jgi:hypothetical protein
MVRLVFECNHFGGKMHFLFFSLKTLVLKESRARKASAL